VAELGESLRRSDSLINLKDQRFIVWANEGDAPSVLGELPASTGVPVDRSAFLAFGRWLSAGSASALERAATALRDHGNGFDLVVETRCGNLLEVMGRKTAFHAAIRFLSLSDVQKEHARLKLEHQRLLGDN